MGFRDAIPFPTEVIFDGELVASTWRLPMAARHSGRAEEVKDLVLRTNYRGAITGSP